MNRNYRQRAFTLVELLVVIGVIAVLIAILLPSLSRARQRAREVQCLSQLRQLATGFHGYLADHKGRSIDYRDDADNVLWMTALRPYYGQTDGIRLCPTVESELDPPTVDRTGSFARSFVYRATVGAYGMNGFCYRPGSQAIAFSGYPAEAFHVPHARESSRVPLFFDANHPDAWPRDTDVPTDDVGESLLPMMQRVYLARHRQAVNIAFLDGHAATVPLAELWQLQWSRAFQPRDANAVTAAAP